MSDNKIQELKDKYGNKAKQIIESGLNLASAGNNKYRCPNTVAHKRQDKNPSMGWHEQANQFHCFTCGMKIDIYSFYREHCNYSHNEIISEVTEDNDNLLSKRKSFKDLCAELKPIDQKCIDYVKLRGISEETILKHDLRAYKGDISFLYKKFDNLVGVKTRMPKKVVEGVKMKSITGSKFNLYNSNNLTDSKSEIVICEGEFDCMVLDECGIENAVSVPTGANSLNALFEQEAELLKQYDTIIIASDNDEHGSNMDEKFVDKFGDKIKLIDKKMMGDIKDINELLLKKGKEKVVELIDSARLKVEGRRDLDIDGYKGISSRSGRYIGTGIHELDNAINQLAPGCVTIVVGRTNAGKTTFVRQIMSNAINTGNKVYAVLGEGDQEMFLNEFYKGVIGRNPNHYDEIKNNIRIHKEPKKEVLKALSKWHKGKLVLFNKGESRLKTTEELFKILSHEIKFKNHNLIVLDNLMSLLSISSSSEKNDAQGNFIQRCCDMAKLYNTHIIVVVHPNKEYRTNTELNIENISGTMDIGNKADNVIAVVRSYPKDGEPESIISNGSIKVLKNRYYSELPTVGTFFEKETGLLLGIDKETSQPIGYSFHWQQYLESEIGLNKDIEKIEREQAIYAQSDIGEWMT